MKAKGSLKRKLNLKMCANKIGTKLVSWQRQNLILDFWWQVMWKNSLLLASDWYGIDWQTLNFPNGTDID